MVRYLPFLVSLVLSVYALFSCIQTRDEDVPHLPKLLWIALIVLVPFVGPITWLLMARKSRARREAPGPAGHGSGGFGPPRRTTGPDDDPEFLAWLDRDRGRRGPSQPPRPAGPQAGAGPDGEDGPDPDGEGTADDRRPR